MFLDDNHRAGYGSVTITGTGSVGLDGDFITGDATINLGNSPASSFFIDHESIFNEDPGRKLTLYNQNNTTIGGNLTVTGGIDTEVYNTAVTGNVSITTDSAPAGKASSVVLGTVMVGGQLTINQADGNTGAFVDFTTVGGPASVTQGNGNNTIGLQTAAVQGGTTLTQGTGVGAIFIDSEGQLTNNSTRFPGVVPNDTPFLNQLNSANILPADSGSTFGGAVTAAQGTGVHQLEIGQDAAAASTFNAAAQFTAANLNTLDASVRASGTQPTLINYTAAPSTGGSASSGATQAQKSHVMRDAFLAAEGLATGNNMLLGLGLNDYLNFIKGLPSDVQAQLRKEFLTDALFLSFSQSG